MEIIDYIKDDTLILAIKGKIDAVTSPLLGEQITGFIDRGHKKFVLDCANLDYISSAGIRVFYQTWNRLETMSGRLVIASPKPHVKKVFDIINLGSDFPIFAGVDDAIKTLSP